MCFCYNKYFIFLYYLIIYLNKMWICYLFLLDSNTPNNYCMPHYTKFNSNLLDSNSIQFKFTWFEHPNLNTPNNLNTHKNYWVITQCQMCLSYTAGHVHWKIHHHSCIHHMRLTRTVCLFKIDLETIHSYGDNKAPLFCFLIHHMGLTRIDWVYLGGYHIINKVDIWMRFSFLRPKPYICIKMIHEMRIVV